jgi:hypothetical protein
MKHTRVELQTLEDGIRTETYSTVTKKEMLRIRRNLGKPALITTQHV